MKSKLLLTISLFMLVSATYSKVSEARSLTPSSVRVAGQTTVIHIPPHTFEITKLQGIPTFLNKEDSDRYTFNCETTGVPTAECLDCLDRLFDYYVTEYKISQYIATANPIDFQVLQDMVEELSKKARIFNAFCPEALNAGFPEPEPDSDDGLPDELQDDGADSDDRLDEGK